VDQPPRKPPRQSQCRRILSGVMTTDDCVDRSQASSESSTPCLVSGDIDPERCRCHQSAIVRRHHEQRACRGHGERGKQYQGIDHTMNNKDSAARLRLAGLTEGPLSRPQSAARPGPQ
jgi:hypothetical protein